MKQSRHAMNGCDWIRINPILVKSGDRIKTDSYKKHCQLNQGDGYGVDPRHVDGYIRRKFGTRGFNPYIRIRALSIAQYKQEVLIATERVLNEGIKKAEAIAQHWGITHS